MTPETGTLAELALQWIRAEREARKDPKDTQANIADEVPIALDRVYQVLAGEVRWSEASPGDRAIWRGRLRDVERFDAWWRTQAHDRNMALKLPPIPPPPGEVDPYNQTAPAPRPVPRPGRPKRERARWYANVYDTIVVTRSGLKDRDYAGEGLFSTYATKLFNNRNVGCYDWSNLQVAGHIHGDMTFYIDTMYVRPTNLSLFAASAHNLFVQLIANGKPTGGSGRIHASELLMGIPVRVLVPPRSTFELDIDCSPGHLEREWQEGMEHRTYRLTFHLEGVLTDSP